MRKLLMISLLCILCGAAQAQKIKIKTGIEVLKEQNFKCLEGKRVGLITNPTGVDNQMKVTSKPNIHNHSKFTEIVWSKLGNSEPLANYSVAQNEIEQIQSGTGKCNLYFDFENWN